VRPVFVAALSVAALALAGSSNAAPRPTAWPLAPTSALSGSVGPAAPGDGPSTSSGLHLACIPGRRIAINQPIENRSLMPVTLTGAALDPPSVQVIRRIAVQFRLAPRPPNGDGLVLGLRPWSAARSARMTIPPGRAAWVQSDFVMSGCALLAPDRSLIANKAVTLTYRSNGRAGSERIPVPWTRIVLAR
jgi:hypothetical protein